MAPTNRNTMTCKMLRDELRRKGAKVSGRKAELIERLKHIQETMETIPKSDMKQKRKTSDTEYEEENVGGRERFDETMLSKSQSDDGVSASSRSVFFNTVAWYATSVVCTATTKLITFVPKLFLSTNQFLVATLCAACACMFISGRIRPVKASCQGMLWLLSVAFVVGMLSLNESLSSMHVSLAMTLRATEPIFTVALTAIFLTWDRMPSRGPLLSLIPVVVGAGLSSFDSVDFSLRGALLLGVSNLSFATRAIVYKRVKSDSGLSSCEMFYYICRNGSAIYLILWSTYVFVNEDDPSDLVPSLDTTQYRLLLLNGVCYFAYLQLSVVVLSQVSAISHGVLNAMRRPATIVATTLWFGRAVTSVNAIGISLACVGSLLYSVAQKAGAGKK